MWLTIARIKATWMNQAIADMLDHCFEESMLSLAGVFSEYEPGEQAAASEQLLG